MSDQVLFYGLAGYLIGLPLGALLAIKIIDWLQATDSDLDRFMGAGFFALIWPFLALAGAVCLSLWSLGRFGDICSRGCKALMAVRKATKKTDVLEGRID